MPIDLSDTSIDVNDAKYQKLLTNLQGNILKGHGRDLTVQIFFEFTGTAEESRKWIANFARNHVTSAAEQIQQTIRHKANPAVSDNFSNLFLSATGFEALDFSKENFPEGSPFVQASFKNGMKAAASELNDPPFSELEDGFKGQIDGMILLANDKANQINLASLENEIVTDIQTIAKVLVVEHGIGQVSVKGEPVEHFGYRDGISQPLFLEDEIEAENQGDGPPKWDPTAPLKLVLLADPNATEEDCFGSYFVFRKLEQNVRAFKEAEKKLADQLGLVGSDRERAGALAVGRFENGSPVTLSEKPAKANFNNFSYDDDSGATKCPFHAHIRKTNPRGDNASREPLEEEKMHRIARRGIPYGTREIAPGVEQPLEDLPTGGVGLLFMCFQSNIANQFAFIQKLWANNSDFVSDDTGVDPVIGQTMTAQSQKWSSKFGGAADQEFDFSGFVRLRGGEFFFAPSLPFLKKMK